jgi:hypothetical protein
VANAATHCQSATSGLIRHRRFFVAYGTFIGKDDSTFALFEHKNCKIVLSDITVVAWIILVVKSSTLLQATPKTQRTLPNAPNVILKKLNCVSMAFECQISRFLFPVNYTSLFNS